MAYFEVYDIETGDLIASGTQDECGAAIGVSGRTLQQNASLYATGEYTKYRIERNDAPSKPTSAYLSAIKAWDDFCEPIRKRYGIPIRPLEVKEK